jgi:hypothetical protein
MGSTTLVLMLFSIPGIVSRSGETVLGISRFIGFLLAIVLSFDIGATESRHPTSSIGRLGLIGCTVGEFQFPVA